MAQPLFRKIARRNPFAVQSLPWLARLYRSAYRKRRRFSKRVIGRPAQKLFRIAYRTFRAKGRGRISLSLQDGVRELAFDARNTQFGALYLPQYGDGYEAETAALLDVLVGARDVFFDIGSNWGYFALFVASRPGFAGTIHAFEPLPSSYADLEDLVRQAGLAERVRCHEIALSDHEGGARMSLEDGIHSGLARLRGGATGPPISLKPLDSLGLPAPNVIKADVEGHEGEMFTGARRTLERARPFVLFESWREFDDPDITLAPFRVLEALGYTFFQPAWTAEAEGYRYGLAGDAPDPSGEATLALIPFPPEQRFLLDDQINVLACPADRLAALGALFGPD